MLEKYALFRVVRALSLETEEFSLRGIAKKAGVGPSTAKICLDFLRENSLVDRKVVGKTHLFRMSNASVLARQVKILLILGEINSSGLVLQLVERLSSEGLVSVCVYGSAAKGTDDRKSDIDFLIITRKRVNHLALKAEGKLTREVNYTKYTYSEWKEKAEKDPVFYKEVIFNCIPLYGEKPVVS